MCVIFKWRNWCYLRITLTRKSGKHLHATFGALNSCFDLIRSHQQCTPWSSPLEIEPTTTECKSRNSTTGLPIHKRYRINKPWWIARPLWPNVSWRYVFPTANTATSGATSSQIGVMSPHNISLIGRIYNNIIFKWRNRCYLRIKIYSVCVYIRHYIYMCVCVCVCVCVNVNALGIV